MKISKKALSQWLPIIITAVCAAVTAVVYTLGASELSLVKYLQIASTLLIAAALPLLSVMAKREFPALLNYLIVIHTILSLDLGSVLSLYELLPFWDTLLHGCFGFISCAVLTFILISWGGDKLNRAGFLFFIALATMGCAALWELFEFCSDLIIESDAQRVGESIARGFTPVFDTMIDIAITVVGVLAFLVAIWIDKLFGYRVARTLKNDNNRK